jgi:hypothetical protein
MMIFKFHGPVKTESAVIRLLKVPMLFVGIACSALLGVIAV